MKLNDLKKFFGKLSEKDKRIKLIVILGIVGIILLFVSELIPQKKYEQTEIISDDPVTEDTYAYKNQIENELIKMLEQIKGVGSVSVMVTIEGTTEYVYAEELDTVTDKDGEQSREQYQNKIVMTDQNGEKQALVKQIIKPEICGVMIVCEGGGNVSVNERVIKAVATALDLPSSQICVECKK